MPTHWHGVLNLQYDTDTVKPTTRRASPNVRPLSRAVFQTNSQHAFFIALFAAKQKFPPTQIYVPRGHFSIVYIFYYVLHPATEYSTQIVDFCSADALAAAQPVYSAAAYAVLIDKRIGGLPFLFKRYPKRGVRNHTFIINYSQIIDNSHNVDYNQEKPLKE